MLQATVMEPEVTTSMVATVKKTGYASSHHWRCHLDSDLIFYYSLDGYFITDENSVADYKTKRYLQSFSARLQLFYLMLSHSYFKSGPPTRKGFKRCQYFDSAMFKLC